MMAGNILPILRQTRFDMQFRYLPGIMKLLRAQESLHRLSSLLHLDGPNELLLQVEYAILCCMLYARIR